MKNVLTTVLVHRYYYVDNVYDEVIDAYTKIIDAYTKITNAYTKIVSVATHNSGKDIVKRYADNDLPMNIFGYVYLTYIKDLTRIISNGEISIINIILHYAGQKQHPEKWSIPYVKDENYVGSGSYIKGKNGSLARRGKENHECIVVAYAENKLELDIMEARLINNEIMKYGLIKNEGLCVNRKPGGCNPYIPLHGACMEGRPPVDISFIYNDGKILTLHGTVEACNYFGKLASYQSHFSKMCKGKLSVPPWLKKLGVTRVCYKDDLDKELAA